MSSITELVNYFDVNSKAFELQVHDLMIDNNDVPFNSQEIDAVQNIIISAINARMNQATTRHNGLVILDKFSPRFTKDLLSKYGLLWITKSTLVLENAHSNVQEVTVACKVLGLLIERCKEIPELHKQISMQNVKQLVNILGSLQTNVKCGAAYYLLAVLLYHYPEVCERHQEFIKKMVLLQIDSTQEYLVNASAKCYVLLTKATERSFKSPPAKPEYTGWTYNEVLICNNLHTIMDELFSGLIELESVNIWDQLELPVISEENVTHYYNKQKQRFLNLCTYLSSMLRGYEVKNSVLPHDIFEVLCRGLAITPLNLKDRNSFKEQMLYIILPKLHIGLLSVLDAFISGFAQELIPFGNTILQLLQQTLQWTNTVLDKQTTFSNNKPFKSVRIYIYKCFSLWLTSTNTLSGIETIANACVIFILKDITPERDCILLTVQRTQHLSKRAMKRFKESQYENSSILSNGKASTASECLDSDICREALIALQNILFSGGVLLKPTFYKSVQNTVISLLYHFYLDSPEQSFYKNHDTCRLELFKVLKALQMNPLTVLAFPTHYCLEISRMAIHDINPNIVQEAKLALAELEKIIHPAAPTLQLPQQQEPDDKFVFESQTEEIALTTVESDKRNSVEKELSQDIDTTSPTCKRPKVAPE